MTPTHDRWTEFADRLEGPEGCNFQKGENDNITWECGGGHDQTRSAGILILMGFTPEAVEASLNFFTDHGGHCDCEVLFNVASRFILNNSD